MDFLNGPFPWVESMLLIMPLIAAAAIFALWIHFGNRAKPPSQSAYDYIIVGAGHAGCFAARRLVAGLNKKDGSSSVLLVDRTDVDGALRRGWGAYVRPHVSVMKTLPEAVVEAFDDVETTWPMTAAKLEEAEQSPLTWASQLPTVARLPSQRHQIGLPLVGDGAAAGRNGVYFELREHNSVQDLDLVNAVVKVATGTDNKLTAVRASKAIILCVGARALSQLMPEGTLLPVKDATAVPLTFQARPNLRVPHSVPNHCEAMADDVELARDDNDDDGASDDGSGVQYVMRFVPHSVFGHGRFQHTFTLAITLPKDADGKVDLRIARRGLRRARQLVGGTTLHHLTTGRELIDVHSFSAEVPRGLALSVLYDSAEDVKKKVGASRSLRVSRLIQDEVVTDAYLDAYVQSHQLDAGEATGCAPLGTVTSAAADSLGRLLGPADIGPIYVADASVVSDALLRGATACSLAVACAVVDAILKK